MTDADSRTTLSTHKSWLRSIAVGAFVLLLVWLPFPLGSAISWGTGVFEVGTGLCVLFWVIANFGNPLVLIPKDIVVWLALALFGTSLCWALIQSLPILPQGLAHPIWAMSRDLLDLPVKATISLDPWKTQGEVLKLLAYLACALLSYSMSQNYRYATVLFNAAIFIPAAYVIYAFGLIFWGVTQPQLIYGVPFPEPYVTGPFMLHNSFATYCGIAALAAISQAVSRSAGNVITDRGIRRFALSLISYCFGRGAALLIASVLLMTGVIASASRGGTAALIVGLLAMAAISVTLTRRPATRIASALSIILLFLPIIVFLFINNTTLPARVNVLLDAGTADSVRLELWLVAEHMIISAPWQGLGLGTFQDAYPLYATRALPYVMDKAHCDYLELIAGLGVPAASAILLAIFLMMVVCLRGSLTRRRHVYFALTGFCVSVLVAAHSAVDFSLQIPAVGLSYAVILGIGVAQSYRTTK